MKEFLSQKQVPFLDRNIREDAAALEELRRLGYSSVPVIGNEQIVGFDRQKIEQALRS